MRKKRKDPAAVALGRFDVDGNKITPTTPLNKTPLNKMVVYAGIGRYSSFARDGGEETSSIPALRLHVLAVPAADLATAIQAYGADADVVSVDRDHWRVAEAAPSDPASSAWPAGIP